MGLLRDLLRSLTKKQYGTPSRTLRGELVKSRAEQRIADYLTRQGVHYIYEYEAKTNALVFKKTFAKPDFYLPDYKVYVEYWGLVNASKDYRKYMMRKMALYHENKIRFISLYPSSLGNLDWVFRAKFKEVTGLELPTPNRRDVSSAKYCTNCGARLAAPFRFCTHCGNVVSKGATVGSVK